MKVDRSPRNRNETADLTRPIMGALNAMSGVRVARNNTGMLTADEATNGHNYRVRYGLGLGSSDLVGIVRMDGGVGRAFCLEVKWPGKPPTEDQIVWLRVVRSLGGFATVVHSIEEALAAVVRCREGLSE